MSGWIKIHRAMIDHWINKDARKYSRFEAWMDILLSVNYSDAKVTIKNTVYDVKRGQSIYSLDTWSKRWGWNKSATRRFFSLLEKDGMIELKTDTQTTHLTVCNYARYQDERNTNETRMKHKRHTDETQTTPREEEQEEEQEQNKANSTFIQAETYINEYNFVFNKNHKVTDDVKKALKIKLKEYSIDDIVAALHKSRTADCWIADKLHSDPLKLLRQRNTNGPVDYIGEILNAKPKRNTSDTIGRVSNL